MTARHIDMTYAPDGRTLQSLEADGRAPSSSFPVAPGAPARRIAGDDDRHARCRLTAAHGHQPERAGERPGRSAGGRRQRRRGGSRPRRCARPARAGRGCRTPSSKAASTSPKARPAAGKTPALDRHARSTRLIVDTKPGLGALERADFRGNVRFVDGELTAEAPRALYNIDRDHARSLAVGRRRGHRTAPEQSAAHRAGAQHPPDAVDAEAEGRYRRAQHHQAAESQPRRARRRAAGAAPLRPECRRTSRRC